MDIAVELRRHCIKTGVKKKYSKLINQYFSSTLSCREKKEIEAQIQALKFILENINFSRLRTIYPELSGINILSITLMIPENYNELKIAYHDKIIEPEWKTSNKG
ncbi:MAG: hypothetical protein GY707_18690 [Desulfobacteraceae bacterium]|nr:hypothetical protein [Desulfobacteraceae bacterium]